MLFFIILFNLRKKNVPHLNTSHVILYRFTASPPGDRRGHLNTSHVILYQTEPAGKTLEERDLNTSHVILYRITY